MKVQLNREQRVFLLQSLKDGFIDLEAMEACGIRGRDKFDDMTNEELADEIVRLDVSIRTANDPLSERICKGCYKAGGCWLSLMARNTDREMSNKIRELMK